MFPAFQGLGWLGIVIAAAFSFLFGMLWYGPLFGKNWMKLVGIKKEDMKMENPGLTMSSAILGSFLTAFTLELFLNWADVSLFHAGLGIALFSFLGFSGPKMMDGVLWGNQGWALFGFNAAYTILAYVGMVAVLFYV